MERGWFSALPSVTGIGSLLLGSIVLLGLAFELSGPPALLSIGAGAAASFVLGGVSLLMLVRGSGAHRWSRIFAIGLLILTGLAWLASLLAVVGVSPLEPFRMGVQSALAFTIEGAALLLLSGTSPAARRIGGGEAALASAFIGWVGLIAYTYNLGEPLWDSASQMVLTAFGVTLLGLGTAAADAAGPLQVLRSPGPGGALSRYLLPFMAIAPFGLGWAGLAGQRAGWYEPTTGMASLTIASTMLFGFIVVTYARRLDRSDAALRESRKRTSTALASLGVGVWEIDPATRSVLWADNMSPLLGSSPDAIRCVDDIVRHMHPDDREGLAAAIDRALATSGEFDVESRVVLPDATVRWMHSTGRVLADRSTDGDPGRLIGVTADVTSRHLLEAQFLQAQKMEAVGQLAGGVAHDFNNLLTAILGYSELLRDRVVDRAGRGTLDEVVKAATRATALTKQLLAFSRRQAPEATVLNANDVVQGVLDMLHRLIGEDVVLSTALAEGLDPVRIDGGQLEQVIVNLVLNARDAMPHGGRIRVETVREHVEAGVHAHRGLIAPGEYVVLSIADTGIGMTEDVRAHLFQPFFTTKDREKGTGLGLATVYGIVTAWHGYIRVESEAGKGAVFRIYLPSVADSPPDLAAPVVDPSILRIEAPRSSVLIVEDEEAVRYLSRAILERAGHRVYEASTADEAESLLAQVGGVDVLVSDVMLPGGSGPELFERLRVRYPGLRVVFMSGYLEDQALGETRVDQSMVFIQKPFAAETLLNSVAALLDTVGTGGS